MKKTLSIIAILAVSATACNKAEIDPGNGELTPTGKMITETISATNENNRTKAEIAADASFTWSIGDQLAVHVSDGKYYTTEALTSGGGNSATFTVTYPDGKTRDAFAIFPASIVATSADNYGQSEHTLDVTLPASYTLAQVCGTVTPCPMIADNTGSGWTFYQLCGLLRLTVNEIPASTKRLEINFGGKNVAGRFSIPATVKAGGDDSSTIGLDNANGSNSATITITKDGTDVVLGETSLDLNIPLPVGDYSGITVVAYNTLSGGSPSLAGTAPFVGYTAKRAKGTKRTAEIKDGVFAVSSSKRVIIAPGNLQAKTTNYGASWTWQFATNPWDFMGEKAGSANIKINGNGTVSVNGTVDLFAWVGASNTTWSGELGTQENAAMHGITNVTTMGNATDYGDTVSESLKSDWGKTIKDRSVWRTLNKDEWTYLFVERSGGTVNGINHARLTYANITEPNVDGFILFPDGVTISASEADWGTINGDSSSSTKTQCSIAQWTALEAKGCVFLPAAGHRRYFSSTWEFVSDNLYWSSSYRGGNVEQATAKGLYNLTGEAGIKRQRGCAVRLVHDIN